MEQTPTNQSAQQPAAAGAPKKKRRPRKPKKRPAASDSGDADRNAVGTSADTPATSHVLRLSYLGPQQSLTSAKRGRGGSRAARGTSTRGKGRRRPGQAPASNSAGASETSAAEQPARPTSTRGGRPKRGRGGRGGRGGGGGGHAKRSMELAGQAASMSEELRAGRYECMVCMERIGKKAAVWTCNGCFAIFHIRCITTWSAKSLQDGTSWACPGCRATFQKKPKGSCFCGKTAKPAVDPYLVPHSCGELCKRKREGTSCPHPCNSACHPGPCSPCPAIGPENRCFCGRTAYRLRCGEEDPGQSCESVCGAVLNCRQHLCSSVCHPGMCEECTVQVEQWCYCGRTVEQRTCGTGVLDTFVPHGGEFSCQKQCGRLLECGNHTCEDACHAGPCTPCVTGLHITTCPCGAVSQADLAAQKGSEPRASCLEPVRTCRSVCGKPLHCGDHACPLPCHLGPCAPCENVSKRPCRCGFSVQEVACAVLNPPPRPSRPDKLEAGEREEGEIDSSAETKEEKAEEPEEPEEPSGPFEVTCERRCNVLRACGRHRCTTVCCPLYNMGKEAHQCPLPCPKMLSCGNHQCNQGCHKGRCPRCHEASFDELICPCTRTVVYPPILCGTKNPDCPYPCTREHSCSHEVKHNCHFEDSCPNCVILVTKMCAGGHEPQTVPCYVQDPSCGKLCKKVLCCGLHACTRVCHADRCEPIEFPVSGESCGHPCGAELLSCPHPCAQPCHPGKPCARVACQQEVYVTCPCRRRVDRGKCLQGADDSPDEDLSHGYVRLACDEQCALQQRVQQLASAFGRSDSEAGVPGVAPGMASEQQRPPPYPMLFVDTASSMPRFLRKVEQAFEDLVRSDAQEYQFEPMTRIYRQLVVDLAAFYKLQVRVVDSEPMMSVIVTKTRATALPKDALSDVIQRNPVPRLPGTGPGTLPTSGRLFAIHLHGLNHSIRTEQIEAVLLRPFKGEYYLQWVDDENCIVFFNDEKTMQAALMAGSNTMFKVRPLKDDDGSSMFKDSAAALRWKAEKEAASTLVPARARYVIPARQPVGDDEDWGETREAEVAGMAEEEDDAAYGTCEVEHIDPNSVSFVKDAVPLAENRFSALASDGVPVVEDWTELLDSGDTVIFQGTDAKKAEAEAKRAEAEVTVETNEEEKKEGEEKVDEEDEEQGKKEGSEGVQKKEEKEEEEAAVEQA